MLVLSRQQDQKVLFPNLGITVEIVSVKGRNVRLGIDAPPEIRILRDEIAEEWDFKQREKLSDAAETDQARNQHDLKNQLNHIGLLVQVAQKKLEKGLVNEAIEHVESALTNLSSLDQSFQEKPSEAVREQPSGYAMQSSQANDSAVSNSAISTTNKWKALLIEDNVNERNLMATVLGMSGIAVDVVGNGEEAIDYLLANEHPDFVLIDMEMPKLAGPETIQYIRQKLEFSDLAIYGVSGLNRSQTNLELGNKGVSGWFAKPVDAGQMIKRILCDALGTNPEAQLN